VIGRYEYALLIVAGVLLYSLAVIVVLVHDWWKHRGMR
jgi:hypothetical protein